MKKSTFALFLNFLVSIAFAQDVIYTVSGELNTQKIALDSILVENLSNGTHTLFGNLPPHDFYQINLTQNAFWGTVGISHINRTPVFTEAQNLPGKLVVLYSGSSPVDVRLSVFTISGQRVFTSIQKMVLPGNSLNVSLGSQGVFFIRLDAPTGTQTFKTVGSVNIKDFEITVSQGDNLKGIVKSGFVSYSGDFSYQPGDTIRISAYKNEYYARPIGKKIVSSENVNFLFDVSATITDSISDAFVALNEITTNVTAYDTLTGSVQITFNGDNPGLLPGDIITVDVDTMGYLRKVVETTEADGTITVTTEQAYLNELFVGKDFKLHTGLMNPGVQLKSTSSQEEISKALTDEKGFIHPVKVIYRGKSGELITKSALTGLGENDEVIPIIDFYRDLKMDLYGEKGDNVHFYVDEGHVSLTSDAIFEFDFDYEGELTKDTKVKKGDINTFSFYLDSRAEFLTKLALDMSAAYEKEKTKTLIDLKEVSAEFLIGPVPFWVTFDVDVLGYYHLNADAALHADWGFESNHTLKIGSTYNRHTDEFTVINEYEPENSIFPLNIEGEVNASARFEVYPRAEIKFYNFFGPYAEIVPYVEGKYNAKLQSQITSNGAETFIAWNSGIDLGLDFRTGMELTFLGLFNKEFVPTTLNGPVWPLWKSPTEIDLLTTLPEAVDGGAVIPLKLRVTDLLEIPETLCPIYITGDGTFSKQILFTNTSGEATVDWKVGDTEGINEFTATIYNADKTVIEKITHSVNVALEKSKPTVTTLEATGISTSSGILNGNVISDGNTTITQRGFYWSTTNQTPDTLDNKEIVSGTTGLFNLTMNGLQANTNYYYRAFATNSEGTETGDVLNFKTDQELSLPTVQTIAATGISTSSGTLNGNVVSDGNATITQRGFYWSTTNQTPDALDNTEIVSGTTGAYNKTISSLQANTSYYYRAFATNSKGTATGEALQFSTNQELSVATVTITEVSGTTYTSANVTGNVTSDGGAAVTSRGICWNITVNPTTADDKTSNGSGTGTFIGELTGLQPGTLYFIRSYAINSQGIAYSQQFDFNTIDLPPVSITSVSPLEATFGEETIFTVSGENLVEGLAFILSDLESITEVDGGTSSSRQFKGIPGSSTGTKNGMIKDTPDGNILFEFQVNFVEAQALPTVATTVVSGVTSNSATSGGNVTSNGGSTVTARGVCWNTTGSPTTSDSKTTDGSGTGSFASNISGLAANTPYYVRAYATNTTGTQYGNEVSFTTPGGEIVYGSFIDSRDGHEYKTVKIGAQTWMAENLAYLPVVSPPLGESYTEPYYYVYGYNGTSVTEAKATDNYKTDGVLYNWSAALASCPAGWHLPTDDEWKQLEMAIGMSQSEVDDEGWRGNNEGEKLKATNGWYNNGNGTDEFGFSAVPGGFRHNDGTFSSIEYNGAWWSVTTDFSSNYARFRILDYNKISVLRGVNFKDSGYSVRCIKD